MDIYLPIKIEASKFSLMIFIPYIKDIIKLNLSIPDGVIDFDSSEKLSKQRWKAILIALDALNRNTPNLTKNISGFGNINKRGVYLQRLAGNSIGKNGEKNFRDAFDGGIPEEFIAFCKDAKINLLAFGGDKKYEYKALSIEEIIKKIKKTSTLQHDSAEIFITIPEADIN